MKKLLQKLSNKKILRPLTIAIVVALVIFAYLYNEKRRDRIFVDNSLVSAPIVNITPASNGQLIEMDVYENEEVKKGDPIAIVGGQTLYANTDGIIVMANREIGSIVGLQKPVVQMINPNDLRIAGTIDENKGLNLLEAGQVVSFTLDAFSGKTYFGYVDNISPSAKQTQLSFSISSERPVQQFVVYVKFPALNYPEIKNGMSAKLTIYTKTK